LSPQIRVHMDLTLCMVSYHTNWDRVILHAFSRLSIEIERVNPILAVIETTGRKWAEYEDY